MSFHCRQFILSLAIACAIVAGPAVQSFAQDEQLTKRQEQAALKFARRHHPELAELLKQLDAEMTSEYDKAIRQIHSVSERLERIRKRSPEDYQLQLEAWKVDSRIKLLAARMTISSDEKLQTEMKKLLSQKYTLKEQQLRRDKERMQSRLERIDKQLETLETDREQLLQKDLARYRKLQPSRTTPTSTRKNNSRQKNAKQKSE
jgi:hypothetical protein